MFVVLTLSLLLGAVGCSAPTEAPAGTAADHPHIQEKVRYLVEAIRTAFPSVQATDRAVWERLHGPGRF